MSRDEYAIRLTHNNGTTSIDEWKPGVPSASLAGRISNADFVASSWGDDVVRAELVVRTVEEHVVAASCRHG